MIKDKRQEVPCIILNMGWGKSGGGWESFLLFSVSASYTMYSPFLFALFRAEEAEPIARIIDAIVIRTDSTDDKSLTIQVITNAARPIKAKNIAIRLP